MAGPESEQVEKICDALAETIANYLADECPAEAIQILGPAPCILERLRGKYRYHLLFKNFIGRPGQDALTGFLRDYRMPRRCRHGCRRRCPRLAVNNSHHRQDLAGLTISNIKSIMPRNRDDRAVFAQQLKDC